MRIFHAADLHIGASTKLPDHLHRQEQMLDQIFQNAKKYECDIIILAGDMYEGFELSMYAKDLFLRKLAQYDTIPIVIINGQHDLIDPKYSMLSIIEDFISFKSLQHVYVANMVPKVLNINGWSVLAIPYQHSLTTEHLADIVDNLLATVSDTSRVVATFHGMIYGSSNELGYKFTSGVKLPLRPEIAYWALGDIHQRHAVGENAYYSGSPIQHRFDEIIEDRGGIVVDIELTTQFARLADITYVNFTGIKKLKKVTIANTLEIKELEENMDEYYYTVDSSSLEVMKELPANVITKNKVVDNIKYEYNKDLKHMKFRDILYIEMQANYDRNVCDSAIAKFDELYAKSLG